MSSKFSASIVDILLIVIAILEMKFNYKIYYVSLNAWKMSGSVRIRNLIQSIKVNTKFTFSFSSFSLFQRVNQCLRDACHSSNIPGCMKFIDCGRGHGKNQPSLRSDQWINNTDAVACLDPSPDGFSYGIYENAVPLTIETNIVNKYVYSLFWGFQVCISLFLSLPFVATI